MTCTLLARSSPITAGPRLLPFTEMQMPEVEGRDRTDSPARTPPTPGSTQRRSLARCGPLRGRRHERAHLLGQLEQLVGQAAERGVLGEQVLLDLLCLVQRRIGVLVGALCAL